MDDLVERVADIVEPCGDCSRSVALAAARAITSMVLEEAANVADDYVGDPDDSRWVTAGNIAAAIRAMGAP